MDQGSLHLYNTLTRREEEFKPLQGKEVRFYTCGPTVYDVAHIGNLRSYIFADVLRRTLKLNGYQVRWVMNITDVDDKTIKRTIDKFGPEADVAKLREYTDEYLQKFLKDMEAVNIPTSEPDITFIRVSDRIPEILKFIKDLLAKGYAYKTEDGVYFSIEKYQKDFGDYGALVGPEFLAGKKVGARVKVDEYEKENLSDFALWKARDASDGNIFWTDPKSEIPDGRPGWHIECSVVNQVAFGNVPTDIHTGGVDLIFPHHTNEIAQSQPFYKPFVRHWAHCEHLLVDNKKMAKSAGNFYTLEDLQKEMPDAGMAFRYLVLQTHYRSKMNFTLESLRGAQNRLYNLHSRWLSVTEFSTEESEELKTALNNDLNTPQALSAADKIGDFEILGLSTVELLKKPVIPQNIQDLANKREEARRNQQFKQADDLRDEIDSLGYEVSDTPEGPVVRKKLT